MRKEIRLLDVGCGVGRVAIGILTSSQQVHLYHGVDVSERSICWL